MLKKFKPYKKKINPGHFRVTIFGSARIKRNDKNYRMIFDLAEKIGEMNLDIVTGGGPGIMEAANRGHNKGNKSHAHSFGLLIKLPREQMANESLNVKKDFHRFSKRLDEFMRLSNVVVVAPGGIGTLLELVYTWQLLQVNHMDHIPVILIGEQWKRLIDWMKKNLLRHRYIKAKDLDLVFPVKDNKGAMEIIEESLQLYLKGHKNICKKIRKERK